MNAENSNVNAPLLRVSEVFYSLQGEGPYTGYPFVFVRTFGCNFTCKGFSNPRLHEIEPNKEDLDDQPIRGCDSLYSWHPAYKDTVKQYRPEELYDAMLYALPTPEKLNNPPEGLWANPVSGIKPILCFTGGEPMLQQKAIGSFIQTLTDGSGIETILFETNCSIEITESFATILSEWLFDNEDRKVVWACSPKLTNSGEVPNKAIRPDIFKQYVNFYPYPLRDQVEYYLKFVSNGTKASFDEIHCVSQKMYKVELLSSHSSKQLQPNQVWVMPEGATLAQQQHVQELVAGHCLHYGYMYCTRLHVTLWGNEKAR